MNPMSPVSIARLIADSGTAVPRFTRSSYGLRASSDSVDGSDIEKSRSVEGPVDHVHLLLAREADEVDGVTRDADRQLRIFLGMLHRIEQRVAIEHVDVHV